MELKLPPSIVDYDDVKRILRTLEARDSLFITSAAKAVGGVDEAVPPVSEIPLVGLATLNGVDLMDRASCQKLKSLLETNFETLPQLHISFAVEPSAKVIYTILVWLRANIHPNVLLGVGLQPSIAAGCVLRTPNKVFDMSLRNFVKAQDNYLVELIKGAAGGK